jgi:hypothetical protein
MTVLMGTAHSRFISDDERKLIIARKENVVVFGGVKYSGIRGGDYETKYCFKWNPEVLTDPRNAPWSTCDYCRDIK